MIIQRIFQSTGIPGAALLFLASGATVLSANTMVDYNTNSAASEFFIGGVAQGDVITSTSGPLGTLTFTGNIVSGAGVPSNIDLGDFLLTCTTCTDLTTTVFPAFVFDLVVNDTTDGASGEFVGDSGGTMQVTLDTSTIQVNWESPLQFGPGTSNAMSGNFGSTEFNLVSAISLIVAPNSGTPPGDTTIQGQLTSPNAPEPATFGMLGGALLGLGLIRRRKSVRL